MAGSQDEKINYKVFNDPVHGSIQVHPLAVCIIDTPLFQRLRYLKQLGGVCHVYPGGTHTRFEHSIGVYHLAGKVVNALKDNQPELKITKEQAMCVQIAGLCHDLGHGPFSHRFEIVANELRRKEAEKNNAKAEEWTHELQSVKIINHLFTQDLNVKKAFEDGGFKEEDLECIKDMVLGKKKGFLYEIVCNSESGMDVDKWDYFVRDAYHLGMKTSFEHNRLIFHFKVLPENESEGSPLHICVRDKEQYTVFTMFSTRYALHKTVYQHPVSEGVQMMIGEALVLGAEHLSFAGEGEEPKTVLQALDDLEAYTKLHDGIYHMILNYTVPDPNNTKTPDDEVRTKTEALTEAKELLKRIEKRDLWKCVGQLVPQDECKDHEENDGKGKEEPETILKKLTKELNKEVLSEEVASPQDGLFIAKWTRKDFGRKAENPLKNIHFFDKDGKIVKDEMKLLTAPNQYSLTAIKVYWTGPQKELTDKILKIKEVLDDFAKNNQLRLTNGHE